MLKAVNDQQQAIQNQQIMLQKINAFVTGSRNAAAKTAQQTQNQMGALQY